MRNKLLWQIFNGLSIAAINIIFLMIMARYIAKPIHGVYAILITINNFFLMFSQFGLGAGLVQKKEIEEEDINNAFYLNLGIGTIMYVILFIASYFISDFFENKITPLQLQLLGLTLIISCLSSISFGLLQRDFKFKEIFIINLISYLVGYIFVGIGLAIMGYGISAFISAQLIMQGLRSLIGYMFKKFNFSLKNFTFSSASYLINFGKDFTVIRLLSFTSGKVDKLIFGRTVSLATLANYEKAQYLTLLPPKFINDLTNGFLFSFFSRIQDDKKTLFNYFSGISGLTFLVILHIAFGFKVFDKYIIKMFYGDNWLDIDYLIQYFVYASPFIILASIADALIRALNKFKFSIYVKALYSIFVALFAISASFIQFDTVVLLQVITTIIYGISMIIISLFLLGNSILNFLKSYKMVFVSLILYVIFFIFSSRIPDGYYQWIYVICFELLILGVLFLLKDKLLTIFQKDLLAKLLRFKKP